MLLRRCCDDFGLLSRAFNIDLSMKMSGRRQLSFRVRARHHIIYFMTGILMIFAPALFMRDDTRFHLSFSIIA